MIRAALVLHVSPPKKVGGFFVYKEFVTILVTILGQNDNFVSKGARGTERW